MIRAVLAAILLVVFAMPALAGLADGQSAHERGDYAAAMIEFRKAAAKGHAGAQFAVGGLYHRGEGVQQDHAEAAIWYRKAAEQGHADAQNSLGILYDQGLGVPQDYAEAATWRRKAASQGHSIAQFTLGLMYAKGHGIPRDYVQAHMWYDLAAVQGNGIVQGAARGHRSELEKQMTPADISKAYQLALEWLAQHPQ